MVVSVHLGTSGMVLMFVCVCVCVCVCRRLIPVEALSCESILYWRALCEFVKAKGDEGEEMLEKILPEAAIYADYLYG